MPRSRSHSLRWRSAAAASAPWSACSGPQSALEPAGRGAEQIADIFWWMTGGAVVVWLAFIGITGYAVLARPRGDARTARLLIIGGGVLVPTTVLTGLLAYGLAALPGFLAPAPAGSLRILVVGEQWWWRVRYLPADGPAVELANELRLPVDAPVEIELESRDVIHSFWIPALGGKVDMIPGRRTRLRLEPTRTGTFFGACAEFCGTSHAFMRFAVVVQDEPTFARWLAHQAEPASPPTEPLARSGQELFLASGCGACHTVRGTAADGVIAPDLTHVGGRLSLAAGALRNRADDFRRWIAHPGDFKPGVLMPSFGALSPPQRHALAAYLDGLR